MITTLLLAAGAGTVGVTGGVTVTLPAAVEVPGTELTLGAVATVTGPDEAVVERFRAVSLGYAPAPGYSRLLDRERLALELRKLMPSVEIELVGAPACRVTPAVQTVTAARLLEESGGALRALFADADARITAGPGLADLQVPAAREALELRVDLAGNAQRPGAWSVPVAIVVDGATYRTVWTRWTVEVWQHKRVLRRDVAAGERLSADDFELARIPVGTGSSAHALDPSAFGDAVVRRTMARGSVVTARDVERQIVVRRGDLVSLEIQRGAVRVRALATAAGDARVGDRITVRLEKTGKELVAVVTGPENVTLRLK